MSRSSRTLCATSASPLWFVSTRRRSGERHERASRSVCRCRPADEGGGIVAREVQLTLRNLRNPELTEFVLKDGDAGSGSSMPLPPPATYQGKVRDGGVAVFTITDAVVEGSMLVAPEGWSFIEPLEPQLRLHDVEPGARQRLLRKYNHIVYNARDALDSRPGTTTRVCHPVPPGPPPPPSPLVMSMVADGDAALLRAYPLDSVMPFWLKQETLLNAIDWLYNCVEPEANAHNAYADCGNDFDGGSNDFQARVRIDRLEVWTTGGPDSTRRGELLKQSISMTHQASPLCCGEPHTAGRSSLVHFFSGRDLADGAGVAAGEGGLNYYGELCSRHAISPCCATTPFLKSYPVTTFVAPPSTSSCSSRTRSVTTTLHAKPLPATSPAGCSRNNAARASCLPTPSAVRTCTSIR